MALRRNCGKQGGRVGWPTIFGSCFRATSSVDAATRSTRRRVLRPCLGTSREPTAALRKNWQRSGQRKSRWSGSLSSSQFARMFKASTGVSPHRYQLNTRIGKAQELLLMKRESLSMVAVATGFADQSHFTRTFKRVTGTTPHEWHQNRTPYQAAEKAVSLKGTAFRPSITAVK